MGLEKRRLTEDRRLRKVNDRRAVQRTEHTAVRDGEGATRHVLQRELPVARLQVIPTAAAHARQDNSQIHHSRYTKGAARTFFERFAISCSICTKFMPSAFLTTGVTRPFGVATATLKST